MKRLLLSTIAATAICGASAFAADMPVKAPYASPIFNWTGFYAGIEGGGGWGRESFVDGGGAGGGLISHRPSGGIFGGELGYRWQVNQFVIGIEGTGAWADLNSTLDFPGIVERFKVGSIYTVTGQVGWAVDRWLPYLKGGLADASAFYNAANPITSHQDHQSLGWTLGAGLDYAMAPNWIVGIEYDHFNLNYPGGVSPASNGGGPFTVSNTSRLIIDQVLARLSYKFN